MDAGSSNLLARSSIDSLLCLAATNIIAYPATIYSRNEFAFLHPRAEYRVAVMFVSVCNSMQIDAHEKERLSDRDSEKNAGVLTEHLTDTIATMNDALHANEV
eukprot:scaffold8985_cov161-Skeletonema_marinoi.AAC.3